jgi:NAD-specific glutamate dehydrogenase
MRCLPELDHSPFFSLDLDRCSYGMTTRGVRAFVEGVQRKLLLDPSTLSKVQTGGPDGDLGSNEIKLANEGRTLAVVDGSGVLCDLDGLNQCVHLLRGGCGGEDEQI